MIGKDTHLEASGRDRANIVMIYNGVLISGAAWPTHIMAWTHGEDDVQSVEDTRSRWTVKAEGLGGFRIRWIEKPEGLEGSRRPRVDPTEGMDVSRSRRIDKTNGLNDSRSRWIDKAVGWHDFGSR